MVTNAGKAAPTSLRLYPGLSIMFRNARVRSLANVLKPLHDDVAIVFEVTFLIVVWDRHKYLLAQRLETAAISISYLGIQRLL